MAAFDLSPRSSKRRKTNAYQSPTLPLASRALRAVKEAVLGKSSFRSSLRSPTINGLTGEVAPLHSNDGNSRGNPDTAVDWDIPDSDDAGSATSAQKATIAPRNRISSVRRSGRLGQLQHEGDDIGTPAADCVESISTPTKRKRRKYKARSGSQETDELGGTTKSKETVALVYGEHHTSAGSGGNNEADRPPMVSVGDGNVLGNGPLSNHSRCSNGRASPTDSGTDDELNTGVRAFTTRSGRKSKQQPSITKEDVPVNATPTSTPNRKRGRPRKQLATTATVQDREEDDKEDVPVNATPTTTPNRKRGRPRKQLATAATVQDREEDDLGFKKLPFSRESVNNLLKGAEEQDDLELVAPITAPVASPSTPKKKRDKLAETDTGSLPKSSIRAKTALQTSPELSSDNFLKDHADELRALLEKDTSGSLVTLKTQIMEGLTGKRRLALVNLEEEYQKVHQLVEATVLAGEGNSMLIIGSRGTGKTVLVDTVISDLAVDHGEEFHVVRLNGFIHTDDKLALREIWRQLGREMEVADTLEGRSNYADTLTSLLALLSHSDETSDTELSHVAKSVVFVIDEFDLFASHPRQTLLYNLFDVAQSRNAPIAVLGLTTKIDVVENLEKRVKSRFGQRYIRTSLPKSLSAFQDICKSALISQRPSLSNRLKHNDANFQKLHGVWTSYITALFTHDPTFQNFLLTIYTHSKSIPSFLSASLLPIALLSPTSIPTGHAFASNSLLPPDSKLSLLPSLSTLELALLISAARLDIILDTDVCNFNMAYDEYTQLASRHKAASSAAGQIAGAARVWGREVASGAWERLGELELVMPAAVGSGRAKGGMWRVDVGLEEIGPSVEGMSGAMAKWCREI